MLQIEQGAGTLTLVSRFSRPRAHAVLAGALGGGALLASRALPAVALALAVLAVIVAAAGVRVFRAAFRRGHVQVSAAFPLRPPTERPLAGFSGVRVETLADARRRKAERQARAYRERTGSDLPAWLRPADQPGANDHLRRLVLEGPGAESLAVTVWLADEDDLEPARAAVAALLG